MKRTNHIPAMKPFASIVIVALAISTAAGCAPESRVVDISGDSSESMRASANVLDAAVESLHRQLEAEHPDDVAENLPCDVDEAVNCGQIDEVLASSPALRSFFVAGEQLTEAGILAAEEIQHVRSHALNPQDFLAAEIRAHVAELSAWQHGRPILEQAKMNSDEALWLQRVSLALNPAATPSRARIAELASGPEENSVFPRQQRELRRYGNELRRVAGLATDTNRLLVRAVLRYARVQNLNYSYTVAEQVLIDRQLLFADPEDPQEEEVLGGPPRSREWLEPWRMAGISGSEPIDVDDIRRREDTLLRDRIRDFLERLPDGGFADKLASLPPDHEQYRKLRTAFGRYLQIAENDGWNTQPVRRTYEEGDSGADIVLLRQRLVVEGFLPVAEANVESDTFDAELREALLEFQESSQIPETGETDSDTRDAFNTEPGDRLATIALTMQEWREIRSRRDFNNYHIQVNIPSFYGEVLDHGEVIYRYRVVVGRNTSSWSDSTTETPEFSDRLERMVFNPFWHLPSSIVENEVIPALSGESDYLARHNYEVRKNGSRIFIKQLPGAGNALGQVKFLFPNQFAIYMHDTPTKHLFSRVRRSFSHGCMRVHEPLKLAELLIQRDRQWPDRQIERFVASALRDEGQDTVFHLDSPVPVHIVYLLSRVDEHGHVEFFDDVYGHDGDALEVVRRDINAWLEVEI